MYIRITTNNKGTAYYHLVKSYRDQGKVKQRTLLSLGRVEDGKLEQLAEAISKHTDKTSVFNMAKDVDVEDTYILGPLLVLERMMTNWLYVTSGSVNGPLVSYTVTGKFSSVLPFESLIGESEISRIATLMS